MAKQPHLVQFGAGNIGRSLVGQLFSRAGWKVTFLDVAKNVVEALNARRSYLVTIKDEALPGMPGTLEVGDVCGIDLADREAAVRAVAGADLVGTSVGAGNLESACGIIADALTGREAPLSVMLCENLHDAAKIARSRLESLLPAGYNVDARVGLIEAAIGKMVPNTPPEVRLADPLAVWAEAYNTLYLDADAYIGVPPTVPGVAWRHRFQAYVDRKLFVHNLGHAAAAYAGFLRGKKYIWECMEDGAVRDATRGCMYETSRALAIRHADVFTFDENRATTDDLIRRFGNRVLGDPVFRVGRDLKRKLAPGDRCIGGLRLLADTGIANDYSVRAVAAAMLFQAVDEEGKPFPGDSGIVELAKSSGPEAVLTGLCGLDAHRDAEPVAKIAKFYRDFR
ncbi:MAG: hypothetical protein LBT97_00535 [Planctomycetota bacterium]|jgi:mannitol-1-phosphate 5-dehydrogenase|nr:hypothetical protein [Planctomycetota bacterium]